MNIMVIFGLATLLFVSFHGLFYMRVIRNISATPQILRVLSTLLGLNLLFNLFYIISRYADIMPHALDYISSLSIGVTFTLLMYIVVHEVIELFHKSIKDVDISKRTFIKKSGDSVMLAATTGYVSAAAYEGSKEPIVNIVELGLFDFTIVQISDLHIGGLIDHDFVKHSVAQINALNPDIVFITGDLVDTDIHAIQESVFALDAIKSKYGIYAILGNHEYFHNPMEIISFMKQSKIKLLLNESVTIPQLGINIVGVTDLFGLRVNLLEPDIHKAYRHTNPEYKSILLAHQPKFIEYLGGYKPELILSGHTHGGQIFPFNYLVKLQQPFVKGLHLLPQGSRIYVNSGIGFWGPPMRLGSQAEIAYLI